ncbi:MAG: GAF domain-containing protein, partial [Bdellovibrionota bacterium]
MPIEAIRERERLNSVNSYYLGSRDPALDGLARLAGAIFGVPYASVSIVEKDRAILVGALGLEFESVDRCDSICSGVIRSQMISVVADTHKDERLSKNRFVVGAPNLRFAAAAPIINDKGFVLGGFCLGD